ncbi:hypothetical protein EBT11_06905 [bacterium]|nr:hypothetical protein [bacterium]
MAASLLGARRLLSEKKYYWPQFFFCHRLVPKIFSVVAWSRIFFFLSSPGPEKKFCRRLGEAELLATLGVAASLLGARRLLSEKKYYWPQFIFLSSPGPEKFFLSSPGPEKFFLSSPGPEKKSVAAWARPNCWRRWGWRPVCSVLDTCSAKKNIIGPKFFFCRRLGEAKLLAALGVAAGLLGARHLLSEKKILLAPIFFSVAAWVKPRPFDRRGQLGRRGQPGEGSPLALSARSAGASGPGDRGLAA